MISVVNKKNHVSTSDDIYIGRGSVLGNPYTSIPADKPTKAEFRCETREESLKMFSEYLDKKIQEKDKTICDELNRIWKLVRSGKSVNLVCYCAPQACHGNIIKNIIQSKLNNQTYFGTIDNLEQHQIFVFGSNTEGRHGKGAALTALQKFGAIYGQARGFQGQSYAIITKDLKKSAHPSRTSEQIRNEINALYEFAKVNSDLEFFIPYNCSSENLNFYSATEMASFFGSFKIPKNIIFESEFYKLITSKDNICDVDGITHINVYSNGRTTLGRLLSNFALTKIRIEDDEFESVESWWYWMKMKNINNSSLVPLFSEENLQEVKNKPGVEAKSFFRALYKSKDDLSVFNPTPEQLKEVYILKLEQHPNIKKLLIESTLPFKHYYVMFDKVVNADKFLWTVKIWEELREYYKLK